MPRATFGSSPPRKTAGLFPNGRCWNTILICTESPPRPKLLLSILALIGLALIAIGCQVHSAPRSASTSKPSVSETANQPLRQRPPLSLPLRQPKILVRKGQRQLL